MAKNANGGNAALQVFARVLRAQKRALGGRFHDGQQVRGRKERVKVALPLLFRWNDDAEKQMGVTVDQPRQQRRAAQIEDLCGVGWVDLRTDLLDLAAFDQHGRGRKHITGTWVEESTRLNENDGRRRLGREWAAREEKKDPDSDGRGFFSHRAP